jgi:hypothetical protein
VKCNAPCATCAWTPNNCRSCVDGYQFFGWKCAKKFRFAFTMKLAVKLVDFNKNFFSFLRALAGAVNVSSTNAVTCDKITEGSVNLVGSVAPSGAAGSTEAANQLQSLYGLINTGSIGGMAVEEQSITFPGGEAGKLATTIE